MRLRDECSRVTGRRPAGRIRGRDVVLAALSAIVGLGIAHGIAAHSSTECVRNGCAAAFGATTTEGILVGVAAIVLVGRRLAPRLVLATIAAIATVDAVAGQLAVPMVPALAVAWLGVVHRGDRLASWATIGWAVLVWLPISVGFSHFAAPVAWVIALGLGAEALRTRRTRMAAQRRSREESALRRAEEERLRIARELHDVLAHNISLINVQSGVALHLLDEQPEQAAPALRVINEASGEALRELRSVLGVLRRVDEQAPRHPTAGLERLDELVARAAAAGVDVRTHTAGRPRPLSTPVDLAAYRIVQESLTNVTRHAAGGHATVSLHFGDDALAIEVADDGRARPDSEAPTEEPQGSGNGILGMRERAAALGGDLQAGPRPGAPGFRVSATLPYGAAS